MPTSISKLFERHRVKSTPEPGNPNARSLVAMEQSSRDVSFVSIAATKRMLQEVQSKIVCRAQIANVQHVESRMGKGQGSCVGWRRTIALITTSHLDDAAGYLAVSTAIPDTVDFAGQHRVERTVY